MSYTDVEALERLDGLCDEVCTLVSAAGPLASMRLAERLTVAARRLDAAAGRAAGQASTGVDWVSVGGHRSAKSWLAAATGSDPGAASGLLADQEFLSDHPDLDAARAAGEVSWQHISIIRRIVTRRPWRVARFGEVEAHFVTIAKMAGPATLRGALRTWAEHVDDVEAPDRPDPGWEDRAVHLTQVGDGWDLRGNLPKLEGMVLEGVLHEIMASARRARCVCSQGSCTCPPDDTPAPARRADALVALARTVGAGVPGLLSPGGAERARVLLVTPIGALSADQVPDHLRHLDCRTSQSAAEGGRDKGASPGVRRPASAADITVLLRDMGLTPARWYAGAHAGTLAGRDLGQILCESTVSRLITTPEGIPLDLGRETRVIPPGLRAVLIARDGGCLMPGCTVPAGWCDAHHVQPWHQGGTTSSQNLVLLCRGHHRALHAGQWVINERNGRPAALRTPPHHPRR